MFDQFRQGLYRGGLLAGGLMSSSPLFAQVQLGPQGPYLPGAPAATPATSPVRDPLETHTIVMPSRPQPQSSQMSLWPRKSELKPGSSVPGWYRAVQGLNRRGGTGDEIFRDAFGYADKPSWLDVPLSELPRDPAHQLLQSTDLNLQEAHAAARREFTEWDLRLRDLRGLKAIEFLLSEFQEMRSLARLLSLQTRLAIAEQRYADAAASATTGFRLASALNNDECLIIDLIGVAIARTTQHALLSQIAQPESPNLYWALAALPEPLVSTRPAIDVELTLPERVFPQFAAAETVQWESTEWRIAFRSVVRDAGRVVSNGHAFPKLDSPDWIADLTVLRAVLNAYSGALHDLEADGESAEHLRSLSVGQVVAKHQHRAMQERSRSLLQQSQLADPSMARRIRDSEQQFYARPFAAAEGRSQPAFPTDDLIPSVAQVLHAEWRLLTHQRVLLVLEAIRLHASQHGGQLPQSLDEITVVPVPRHPVTQAPFPYQRTPDGAVLEAPISFEGAPTILARFELKPAVTK